MPVNPLAAPRRSAFRAGAAALIVIVSSGCSNPSIDTIEAFRSARQAGDLESARSYLAPEPRVWYGEHTGDGSPWNLGGGRWHEWDGHFRGHSEFGPWHVEGDGVWAIATETNDYYRLIERRGPARYRITYFLDEDGRISGYMISDPHPGRPEPSAPSRVDEIEAWALANHPEEWAYLRPGGQIDPTGDRAPRTRALINEWRASVGLPRIE